MTGEIQRHRALQRFLLVNGRLITIKANEYYSKIVSEQDYMLCVNDGLIRVESRRAEPNLLTVRITKKGFQYLKRNPYKRAKQDESI